MIAADTSVLLPAVLSNHECHDACFDAMALADTAIAHALIELYATLTRLPAPVKLSPDAAAAAVRGYGSTVIGLEATAIVELTDRLGAIRIAGGATNDALIAATAAHHGAALLTRDHRAIAVYDRLGVDVRFVAT